MARSKIIPWLIRDDYAAIKQLAGDDPELPATYDAWLEAANRLADEHEANGDTIHKIIIHSEGLAAYSKASGIAPDNVGRNAFAIRQVLISRRQTEPA